MHACYNSHSLVQFKFTLQFSYQMLFGTHEIVITDCRKIMERMGFEQWHSSPIHSVIYLGQIPFTIVSDIFTFSSRYVVS